MIYNAIKENSTDEKPDIENIEEGKTISVKEYTQMMEAWSSTKPQ